MGDAGSVGAGGVARPGKRVVVLVRDAPSGSASDGEALRMALGLEIANHQVTLIFLDQGVLYAKRPPEGPQGVAPPWFPYLEMLLQLGHRLMVGRESAAKAGLGEADLAPGIGVIDEASLPAELLRMDAAMVY